MRYANLWDRLVAWVRIEADCWTWTGTVRRHGGGHRPKICIRVPGGGKKTHPKSYNVARVMCEVIHGPAPTPEHEASHLCEDNWLCVCPDHLIWETKKENIARRTQRFRMRAQLEPEIDAGIVSEECPF